MTSSPEERKEMIAAGVWDPRVDWKRTAPVAPSLDHRFGTAAQPHSSQPPPPAVDWIEIAGCRWARGPIRRIRATKGGNPRPIK